MNHPLSKFTTFSKWELSSRSSRYQKQRLAPSSVCERKVKWVRDPTDVFESHRAEGNVKHLNHLMDKPYAVFIEVVQYGNLIDVDVAIGKLLPRRI